MSSFGGSVDSHANGEIDDGVPNAIDPFALSLNENPFPPVPAVRAALIRSIDAANRYPEFQPERLRRLIAGHIGMPADQVVLGAGATGVVMEALQAFTAPGDGIAMASPTFDGHPIVAQMARLNVATVPLDEYGHNNLDGLAEVAAHARVVVVCRPHNPTGTLEPSSEIVRFLSRVPRDTVVLLDEAYIEFVAPELRLDVSALVARFPNLLVVRTFSKAYGLAGLRIGYGLASAALARTLWEHQPPYGMASTSLLAVAASYEAEDQLLQRIRLITAERRYLRMRLSAMRVYTCDAHANFMYLPSRGRSWREVFADTGLHVRLYDDGSARITVGGRESTMAVLSAVGQVR
ncbi:pyridoxal phosphate-dependent aminotransferase [Mycobacterium riyadhense]|uniref:histidinol-phosphate transaminase n=1 Tax=Mycobacterium riyadhense TaxID=486698 RepID=A0A1X2D602_9MYCO|nr:histidinol-phosphate transaminase [Mycobacterium riyadhense]MCV7146543.1 histidinol-phosphate aminotransferase family protein [Mycobacterium riyadhense]ORW83109.1 aminotransferase [Mycobacterium riyadhense]VTP02919.1 Putative phenylalanine aminotransferase [Mycobacterium riyadhense]